MTITNISDFTKCKKSVPILLLDKSWTQSNFIHFIYKQISNKEREHVVSFEEIIYEYNYCSYYVNICASFVGKETN